ncbi:aminotransferase class V-fold PLP-dependent enzyme [Shimia sp. CNT1-13L.2]|uniref:aminotransferase class V-fold PLP-dependent enzyme n=1 Tax=Shimia sp. CNT1-13L.2 TaxID=2959663 RepID=UPI0020CFC0C1|nr:aminotransferase class V-fold PLP-dependent enzyme [Shimia sp. CNT1-13L.2]MCP9484133.1 aminotransferase class V-fold PLP-dependent enzyme [Shimia sp. CNT1-13L.2]
MPSTTSPLTRFRNTLQGEADPIASLVAGQIGKGTFIETPCGRKPLIYADYIASGRPLRQVETFVMEDILPFYANSHTVDSHCGATMTNMREEAREVIATHCGGNTDEHAVIFSGSGATSALNHLVHLLGLRDAAQRGEKTFVLIGPYEHHSNILPWRESGAEVIEIAEAPDGGPDLAQLTMELARCTVEGLVVAAFSAASNVTGVCTDVAKVTRLVKTYGAAMVWDYAGGGPYLPISMAQPGGFGIDAVALSPHKFIGGPGASGVLVMRRDAVKTALPSRPGGGTVAFVNGESHDYVTRLEQREEGGTPNVIGDIRAALAMIVKEVIGQEEISARNAGNAGKAFAAWGDVPGIEILAADRQDRLPFLSFVPRGADGQRMDYRAFTRALSDRFGIQARGGCSCAGPYVHSLMAISDAQSAQIREDILAGDGKTKPGFVRLNLSYLMDDETMDYILNAVIELVAEQADSKAA